MEEEKNCPCCPNHCDVNNLSCGRGREYFGAGKDNKPNNDFDESLMTLEENVIFKMRKCGHYLHHSEKNVNLDFLSESEKQNLSTVLAKCLENWK